MERVKCLLGVCLSVIGLLGVFTDVVSPTPAFASSIHHVDYVGADIGPEFSYEKSADHCSPLRDIAWILTSFSGLLLTVDQIRRTKTTTPDTGKGNRHGKPPH